MIELWRIDAATALRILKSRRVRVVPKAILERVPIPRCIPTRASALDSGPIAALEKEGERIGFQVLFTPMEVRALATTLECTDVDDVWQSLDDLPAHAIPDWSPPLDQREVIRFFDAYARLVRNAKRDGHSVLVYAGSATPPPIG